MENEKNNASPKLDIVFRMLFGERKSKKKYKANKQLQITNNWDRIYHVPIILLR